MKDVDRLRRKPTQALLLLFAAATIPSPAQTLTTLVDFNVSDGQSPSSLVQGTDGNFYGTTFQGGMGEGQVGTVFKVTPAGTLTTLHNFCSQAPSCSDGQYPQSGLIQASDGNFYGTTSGDVEGAGGTIFKITPGGTLTTLYRFCPPAACADGSWPLAALIQASDGNFYGTTSHGGVNDQGTVFKITPAGTLTTLYSFCSQPQCADGLEPIGGLVQASDGNLYGTTGYQGGYGGGTIFKITLGGTLTTLYHFCSEPGCTDGSTPFATLMQAYNGNLYGTTYQGGLNNGGTVFMVTTGGTLTTLYSFCSKDNCADGVRPSASLLQTSDGNFYGTTNGGGANGGPPYTVYGTIFKMSPGGPLTTLYSFCSLSYCFDGSDPVAGLIQASDGNLYGTTAVGGDIHGFSGSGTIFNLAVPLSITTPAITESGGVVNGASFLPGIAPNSWMAIFGTNLSAVTDAWTDASGSGTLPSVLDGVSVSVGGRPAYIYSISPTQINVLAPSSLGSGVVTVTSSGKISAAVNAAVQSFAPAFFQWPGSYAVATRQDYSLAVKNGTFAGTATTPAKPGDVIILWGTGFGPTSPAAPVGVETPPTTTYNTANNVTVTVGGMSAIVYGAALAAGNAGLYQVAIQIPPSLANGDYAVVAMVSDAQSPSATLITVQN
jgi:uncharacterized protein (TIGR03437 family)